MKSDLDVAKTLVLKADNDLKMARIGFDHDAPLDTVAFHVQQAAEKMPNRLAGGCRFVPLSASRSRGVNAIAEAVDFKRRRRPRL